MPCLQPVFVTPVCVQPAVFGISEIVVLYNGVPITENQMFVLPSGTHTFTIRNIGLEPINIASVIVTTVDFGYAVTQPLLSVLGYNQETTFTVIIS